MTILAIIALIVVFGGFILPQCLYLGWKWAGSPTIKRNPHPTKTVEDRARLYADQWSWEGDRPFMA